MENQGDTKDSPNNWLQIRMMYASGDSPDSSMRIRWEVDRKTLRKAKELENLIGLWNVEWAIKEIKDDDGNVVINDVGQEVLSEFLALRTQPSLGNREKVKKKLDEFASQLKQEDLIQKYDYKLITWLQEEQLPSNLRSWDEWFLQIRVLNLLFKTIAEIYDLDVDDYSDIGRARTAYFFHKKVIHHLNNMMHIQDCFVPINLEQSVQGFTRALLMSRNRMLHNDEPAFWSDISFLRLRNETEG